MHDVEHIRLTTNTLSYISFNKVPPIIHVDTFTYYKCIIVQNDRPVARTILHLSNVHSKPGGRGGGTHCRNLVCPLTVGRSPVKEILTHIHRY